MQNISQINKVVPINKTKDAFFQIYNSIDRSWLPHYLENWVNNYSWLRLESASLCLQNFHDFMRKIWEHNLYMLFTKSPNFEFFNEKILEYIYTEYMKERDNSLSQMQMYSGIQATWLYLFEKYLALKKIKQITTQVENSIENIL